MVHFPEYKRWSLILYFITSGLTFESGERVNLNLATLFKFSILLKLGGSALAKGFDFLTYRVFALWTPTVFELLAPSVSNILTPFLVDFGELNVNFFIDYDVFIV